MINATCAAQAAAIWWAQQVGAPTFQLVRPEERDDFSDFAETAMATIAANHPVADDQGTAFVDDLTARIEQMLKPRNWASLGVDYGPDLELAEAAEAAGISLSRFPWKTHMTITSEYVTAALGYGRQHALIWTAPDWVRPACGTYHYIDRGDTYECRDEICGLPRFHDGDHGDWQPDPTRCSSCGGTYSEHHGPKPKQDRCIWSPGGAS